jgi:hypothetical protein
VVSVGVATSKDNLLYILGNKIDKNLKIFEKIDKIKI